jgi:hypothetical protein
MTAIRNFILYSVIVILVGSNLFNYFYSYKFKNDLDLQWGVAIYSIAIELFLFSAYVWLTESRKHNNGFKIVVSGWMTIYLLINLIGVLMGYNLHTKGFMAMLFVTTFFGIAHILIKIWEKYF